MLIINLYKPSLKYTISLYSSSSAIALSRHRYVAPSFSRTLLSQIVSPSRKPRHTTNRTHIDPLSHPRLNRSPDQQSRCSEDEYKYHRLILSRVSLCNTQCQPYHPRHTFGSLSFTQSSLAFPLATSSVRQIPTIAGKLTKTCRKNILHARPLTNRQVIIQTKLPVTVIAVPRSILLPIIILIPLFPLPFSTPAIRLLRLWRHLLYWRIIRHAILRVVRITRKEEMIVHDAGGGGDWGVERDDGAVGEAGAFAERSRCYGKRFMLAGDL